MKLKIDTSYPDNQVKTIIFNSVLKDGKRVRTKVDGVKSIDDFASHICWMSRVHPVVRPVKLWAQAPNKKDPTYGLTFKIAKTEVESPSKINSNVKEFLESDAFLDSDEESDTIETIARTKTIVRVPSAPVKGKQVAQVASDDESNESEESEEESEEESKEEVVTKHAASKTLAKKVESDDEEESDEEVKPAKKTTSKAPAKATTTGKSKKTSA
jgi:hypothetical protein